MNKKPVTQCPTCFGEKKIYDGDDNSHTFDQYVPCDTCGGIGQVEIIEEELGSLDNLEDY